MSVLRDGYIIPFKETAPTLARSPIQFQSYRPDSERGLALSQEISKMMEKGALEIVMDHELGYYSRIFLVEKATGGWRPVIDLSLLNQSVKLWPRS